MKKVHFYWCATLEGPRWIVSKHKIVNDSQKDWLKRQVGESLFLAIEMTDRMWEAADSGKELEKIAHNILMREAIKELDLSVMESINRVESLLV